MTAGMAMLGISVLGGFGLGVVYFGGLWLTLRRLPVARRPVLWVLSSFFVRTGAVLFGLGLLTGGDWPGVLLCLAGFLLARSAAIRVQGPVFGSEVRSRRSQPLAPFSRLEAEALARQSPPVSAGFFSREGAGRRRDEHHS